jgi:hypothetical protein
MKYRVLIVALVGINVIAGCVLYLEHKKRLKTQADLMAVKAYAGQLEASQDKLSDLIHVGSEVYSGVASVLSRNCVFMIRTHQSQREIEACVRTELMFDGIAKGVAGLPAVLKPVSPLKQTGTH